ncbi:MAG: hypothetical protein U0228_26455 [Myxococcaceae bacterium]
MNNDPKQKPDDAPRKILMPEVLPRPMSFPGTAARARVIAHLRLLATTGVATLSLAACPFLVVDPLPPPAKCRSNGGGLSGDLLGTVSPGGTLTTDGGTTVDAGLADGGTPALFTLELRQMGTGNIGVDALVESRNASVVQVRGNVGANDFRVVFAATDPAQPVTLRFKTSCEGGAGVVLVVDCNPSGTGQYSVVLTDAP